MRRPKKKWKMIPKFTPFERSKAMEAGRMMIKEGIDPLNVHMQGLGGQSSFHYKNIAHFFEITGSPFDLVQSNFTLVEKGEGYEKRKASV
jgi:hypothetical protein